jgi:hypothetical protein
MRQRFSLMLRAHTDSCGSDVIFDATAEASRHVRRSFLEICAETNVEPDPPDPPDRSCASSATALPSPRLDGQVWRLGPDAANKTLLATDEEVLTRKHVTSQCQFQERPVFTQPCVPLI